MNTPLATPTKAGAPPVPPVPAARDGRPGTLGPSGQAGPSVQPGPAAGSFLPSVPSASPASPWPGAAAPGQGGRADGAGDPAGQPGPSDPTGPDQGLEAILAEVEKRTLAALEGRLAAREAERAARERQAALAGFAARNPDFERLMAEGGISAARRDNPLLDDLGAYYAALLERERQEAPARIEAARAEAAAETETRLLAELRSKRLAAALGPGPGAAPERGLSPDLARPEGFGGLNAVLAARLAARRAASGL